MQASLAAVQRMLFALLATSLLLAVITRPVPENRRVLGVLGELEEFRTRFVRDEAERMLRAQAETHGQQALELVAKAARSERGPKVRVAADAAPLRPMSVATLDTLAAVVQHAQPGATLDIGIADPAALGASLAFRLAHAGEDAPVTLQTISLVTAALTPADVALEREAARLRTALLDARSELDALTHKVEIYERRVEFQTKARAKALSESRQALDETRAELTQKTAAHEQTQRQYDDAVSRAERPRQPTAPSGKIPQLALARVNIEARTGTRSLDIPVPLEHRRVGVSPLSVSSFPAARAAGLWNEIKNGDVDAAISAVTGRLNWHVSLAGAALLSLLPFGLPLLLVLLVRRIRRAETSYSPFSSDVPSEPPRVGLANRLIEFIALILLPLLAHASATLALYFASKPVLLPLLSAVSCIALGAQAFTKLNDIREQTHSIVRAHTLMPPAPH